VIVHRGLRLERETRMRRILTLLAFLLLAIGPARAVDGTDLLAMSCPTFVAEGTDGQLLTTAILRGLYAEHADSDTMAVWRTQEQRDQYRELCRANPNETAAHIVEKFYNHIEPMVGGALYAHTARCNNFDPGVEKAALVAIGGYYFGYLQDQKAERVMLGSAEVERIANLISACRANPAANLLETARATFSK
jgi:hypothetical protein